MRSPTFALWASGGLALLGMVIFAHLTTTPYPIAWPWLSFIGLAILEEALIGPADGSPPRGPRMILLAAIIMFRKHVDILALVTLTGVIGGGLLTRQRWSAIATRVAYLLILAAIGAAAMRIVGYADTPHFIAATALLILLYVSLNELFRSLPSTQSRPRLPGRVREGASAVLLGACAALIALAWRTPASGPLMLRLAEVAVLADIGLAVGALRGGNVRSVIRHRWRVSGVPTLAAVGAALLLASTRLPSDVAWLSAALGLVAIGAFGIHHRWFPVALMTTGGLCNEIARGVNHGRMPVETAGLPPGVADDFANLSQSTIYAAVDRNTHLAWLADRFPLAPFPGVASVGDVLLGLGVIWLFSALTAKAQARADEPTESRIAA